MERVASRERLDERVGLRPGCCCSLTACVAGKHFAVAGNRSSRRKIRRRAEFDRRQRLMAFAIEKRRQKRDMSDLLLLGSKFCGLKQL